MNRSAAAYGANPRIRQREEVAPTVLEGQVWSGPRKELKFHLVVGFEKNWVLTRSCDANGANPQGLVKRRPKEGFGGYKGLRLVGSRGVVAA